MSNSGATPTRTVWNQARPRNPDSQKLWLYRTPQTKVVTFEIGPCTHQVTGVHTRKTPYAQNWTKKIVLRSTTPHMRYLSYIQAWREVHSACPKVSSKICLHLRFRELLTRFGTVKSIGRTTANKRLIGKYHTIRYILTHSFAKPISWLSSDEGPTRLHFVITSSISSLLTWQNSKFWNSHPCGI